MLSLFPIPETNQMRGERGFSVFKGENVVGKFIMNYFNYASMFHLKHWSH